MRAAKAPPPRPSRGRARGRAGPRGPGPGPRPRADGPGQRTPTGRPNGRRRGTGRGSAGRPRAPGAPAPSARATRAHSRGSRRFSSRASPIKGWAAAAVHPSAAPSSTGANSATSGAPSPANGRNPSPYRSRSRPTLRLSEPGPAGLASAHSTAATSSSTSAFRAASIASDRTFAHRGTRPAARGLAALMVMSLLNHRPPTLKTRESPVSTGDPDILRRLLTAERRGTGMMAEWQTRRVDVRSAQRAGEQQAPAAGAGLGEDDLQVVLHGVWGQEHRRCHLAGVEALSEVGQELPLARRQPVGA